MLRVRLDDLPAGSQARLREMARARDDPNRIARLPIWPLVGLVLGALAGVFAGIYTADAMGRPWDGESRMFAAVTGAAAGTLFLGSAMTLVRRALSPLGSFWYAHASWLIGAHLDRVSAWRLTELDGVEVVNIRRGLFQVDSSVVVTFGREKVMVDAPRRDVAEGFAFVLSAARNVARGLAEHGREEAGFEADLFPSSLAGRPPARRGWARILIDLGVAGAAGGVVAWLVLPPVHDARADDEAFESCVDFARCATYLGEWPEGAHRDAADDRLFDFARPRAALLESYRKLLPGGRHVAEVDAAIEAIAPPGPEGSGER